MKHPLRVRSFEGSRHERATKHAETVRHSELFKPREEEVSKRLVWSANEVLTLLRNKAKITVNKLSTVTCSNLRS